MRTVRHIPLVVMAAVVLAAGANRAAGAPPKRNWDPLRTIPVFHEGRIKPLDTLAREAVSAITGRESPRLGLLGEVFPGDQQTDEGAVPQVLTVQNRDKYQNRKPYREAFRIFPGGEKRKFDPVELLFSWMIEPQRWEHVPFILCEHEQLRKELGLPVLGPQGNHLKYVSPAFLAESESFRKLAKQMFEERRQAAQRGEPLRGLSHLVQELYRRYILYRTVSATPDQPAGDAVVERFSAAFDEVRRHWAMLHQLLGDEQLQEALGVKDPLKQAEDALLQLFQFVQARVVVPRMVDREIEKLRQAMGRVHAVLAAHAGRELPQQQDDQQKQRHANARRLLQRMAERAQAVLDAADQLHVAAYRNQLPVRVVPALVAEALEADRPGTPPSPWLDLMTLVHAPLRVLEVQGYPMREVQQVRKAYREFAAVAGHSGAAADEALFQKRAVGFVQALDALGRAINPLREKLKLKEPDPQQLAYTAYPDRGDLSWGSSWRRVVSEVRYNRIAPFRWAWIVAFLGTLCYALSFGRLRRWMFWVGSAVMFFSVAWGVYGFYLRVAITGWAPVTNMYETVIYVALVVAVLGLWFTFLPLFWSGVQRLWQLSAVPLRRAQREEFARQLAQSPKLAWLRVGLWAARLALALWIFDLLSLRGIGGYDAPMPLWPQGDTAWELNLNTILVWVASLVVVASSMWAIPRAGLALLLGLPWGVVSIRRQRPRWQEAMQQVYRRLPFSVSAAAVSFILFLMAWWSPVMDDGFESLSPVLRNNFWLTVHVLTIVTSYGAGALAWVMSVLAMGYYLFGRYREPAPAKEHQPGHAPAAGEVALSTSLRRRPPEQTATLAHYIYKTFQVAVLLLAAGTILGGLWADVSWGRFWGWDPKEIWALISLLVYLVILHGRYVGMFGNFGMAVGAMAGMTAIAFSWFGVNFVLGAGLHSYGFVDGGLLTALVVFGVLGAGWLLALAAWFRYLRETELPEELAAAEESSRETPTPAAHEAQDAQPESQLAPAKVTQAED